MRDLQERVIAHLKTRRDPAGAIRLWERIGVAYEEGGAEALGDFLEALAEWPDDDRDDDAVRPEEEDES